MAGGSHGRFALSLAGIALGMLMMAYASVPLYRLFCRVTGIGGTTQVATAAPTRSLDRTIVVRFNADTAADLPWEFRPDQRQVSLRIGEQKLVSFTARNRSDAPVTGTATFNVTPYAAGVYFSKIQCFCFDRQTIAPGRTVHFPVSFFVEPAIVDDPNLRGIDSITLSYTFFKAEN